jgi:hypothetical protein
MRAADGSSPATPYRRLSEPAYRGEFIARYDQLRPKPPRELLELLVSLAPTQPPALVVVASRCWWKSGERGLGTDAMRRQ